MAQEQVLITLDPEKAEAARDLVGAGSTSEVVDIALDRLLSAERARRDADAYRQIPLTEDEIALARYRAKGDLADSTDWGSLLSEKNA